MRRRKHRTLQNAIRYGLSYALHTHRPTEAIKRAPEAIEAAVVSYLEDVMRFALANRHLEAEHLVLMLQNPKAFDPKFLETRSTPKAALTELLPKGRE
jgi:hypothetical protein